MSYLKAIGEALESQRYRGLTGGDKGIAKAILKREEPTAEDWELLIGIAQRALKKEFENHLEGIEQDLGDVRWAKELQSKHTETVLRDRLDYLKSLHTGPEINDSGTRSTQKATANQGARDSFREQRVIEMALEFSEANHDD